MNTIQKIAGAIPWFSRASREVMQAAHNEIVELADAAEFFAGFAPLEQLVDDDTCVITVSAGHLRRLRAALEAVRGEA